ncbi:MAG: Bax inhibitor-1/YccA family protein [Spirochaetia bacterium]
MSDRYENTRRSTAVFGEAAGVRTIMRNVYIWMTVGLALTGVVAYAVSNNTAFVRTLIQNQMLFFVLFIVEIGLVIYLSARIMKMSPAAATLSFAAYAILNGITLSIIFLAYTGADIARAFFVTAGTFAGMSIYGTITKRDLSGIGSYLFMGLIGIIIASLVNMFLRSSVLDWIVSLVGVAVFLSLTAYDTQRIKKMSDEMSGQAGEVMYLKLSIIGALKLYLDFINLFLFFLRIFGRRN